MSGNENIGTDKLTYRQLIDLTVGTPEPGHVNFYALHCLLYFFAEKLEILEETVDCEKYGCLSLINTNRPRSSSEMYLHRKFEIHKTRRHRLTAGADREEGPDPAEGGEEAAPPAPPEAEGSPTGAETPVPEAAPEPVSESQPEPDTEPVTEPEPTSEAAGIGSPEPEQVATAEESPAKGTPAGTGSAKGTPGGTPKGGTPKSATPKGGTPKELTPKITPKGSARTSPQGSKKATPVGSAKASPIPSTAMYVKPIPKLEAGELVELDSKELIKEFLEKTEMRVFDLEYKLEQLVQDTLQPKALTIMKDTLTLSLEQAQLIAQLVLSRKHDVGKTERLKCVTKKLRTIQNSIAFTESLDRIRAEHEVGSSGSLSLAPEDDTVDATSVEKVSAVTSTVAPQDAPAEAYDLDLHLNFTQDKMLDLVLELKTDFCSMTNKINEISEALLAQQSQRTLSLISDLTEQVRELRSNVTILRDTFDRSEQKYKAQASSIEESNKILEELMENKVDKTELQILLAGKVDYNLLESKVSHELMREFQCRAEKQFCELQRLIYFNEKNLLQIIENMRKTLGLDSIHEKLKKYKEQNEQDVRRLRDILQEYIDSTNDECMAAGARVKVLQDLSCLSCDATCVMRTREKAKVGKLPNAHASNLLAPLVTYEMGTIRKSGIMGYFRKDDFPHAPNAWMNRQKAPIKICVPRHAGGPHTVSTPKDRVEKINMLKK